VEQQVNIPIRGQSDLSSEFYTSISSIRSIYYNYKNLLRILCRHQWLMNMALSVFTACPTILSL